MVVNMNLAEATALATRALVSNGANPGPAASVARAVVAAQARGRNNVGFAHLPYYCEALRRGAIDGRAEDEGIALPADLYERIQNYCDPA